MRGMFLPLVKVEDFLSLKLYIFTHSSDVAVRMKTGYKATPVTLIISPPVYGKESLTAFLLSRCLEAGGLEVQQHSLKESLQVS